MWDQSSIPEGDPLRQGDLLTDVELPQVKLPFQFVELGGVRGAVIPVKKQAGIVISQCCDNESGTYVAVAPVRRHNNLTPVQQDALMNYEPGIGAHYVYDTFRLEPVPVWLGELPQGQHHVAMLLHAVVVVDRASELIGSRRARMTDEGRRHLRLDLQLLWGRVEAGDEESLASKGFPPGPLDLAQQ